MLSSAAVVQVRTNITDLPLRAVELLVLTPVSILVAGIVNTADCLILVAVAATLAVVQSVHSPSADPFLLRRRHHPSYRSNSDIFKPDERQFCYYLSNHS